MATLTKHQKVSFLKGYIRNHQPLTEEDVIDAGVQLQMPIKIIRNAVWWAHSRNLLEEMTK